MKRSDFEAIREIRGRLGAAGDDAVVPLSSKALAHVKNILKSQEKKGQTAAYHNIAQKHELLDRGLERTNESMQFLNQSKGKLKQNWQAIMAKDAKSAREALIALLSACEALDSEAAAGRINKESETFDKILNRLKKTKSSDPKSCAAFAKEAIEFEKSLIILDNIIAGTQRPNDYFDIYSKFSNDLEDLGERNRRLRQSLHFSKDEYSKADWEHFMERDLEKLKAAIQASHESSMELINSIT